MTGRSTAMTIEEMKARKTELGYTNEQVAELSGVPLGTVQKIFSGETKSPRYDTIRKLTDLLMEKGVPDMYGPGPDQTVSHVAEPAQRYGHSHQAQPVGKEKGPRSKYADYQIPQKKKIGIANGRYKMPPDEMFFDDEITEMFEDI